MVVDLARQYVNSHSRLVQRYRDCLVAVWRDDDGQRRESFTDAYGDSCETRMVKLADILMREGAPAQ